MPPCDVDPDEHASSTGSHPASLEGPSSPPDLTCAFTLPAQLAAAWVTRTRIRAWLEAHALPEQLVDDVEYTTSEAVSNAAEHAYPADVTDGTVDVAAEIVVLDGGRRQVRVTVRDYGHWQPVNPDPGHRGHGLAAMVALAVEITVRHYDVDARGGTEISLLSAVGAVAVAPRSGTSSLGF